VLAQVYWKAGAQKWQEVGGHPSAPALGRSGYWERPSQPVCFMLNITLSLHLCPERGISLQRGIKEEHI
jgi:hypothetical protein